MKKFSVNIRPKVMIIASIITVIAAAAICFAVMYLEGVLLVRDMDYIVLDSGRVASVSDAEYHISPPFMIPRLESARLFLKDGRTYEIQCSYDPVGGEIVIDNRFGYYTFTR